jgi:hypothetical protein
LRTPHNSLSYIKHYFSQVLVSSRRIKLRKSIPNVSYNEL